MGYLQSLGQGSRAVCFFWLVQVKAGHKSIALCQFGPVFEGRHQLSHAQAASLSADIDFKTGNQVGKQGCFRKIEVAEPT